MAVSDRARLLPHPVQTPVVGEVWVDWRLEAELIVLGYEWPARGVRFAVTAFPERADGLWQTTCGELFVADPEGAGYREFNFSPSGRWACYDFAAYRTRVASPQAVTAPHIGFRIDEAHARLEVRLARADLPSSRIGWQVGLCAVTEHDDGTLDHRALAHPAAQPDFHDRAGFALRWE